MVELEDKNTSKQQIVLLNPQSYMKEFLQDLGSDYDITVLEIDDTKVTEKELIGHIEDLRNRKCLCVIGFTQKAAWLHAIINTLLGNRSITPLAYLLSMNKYMQRLVGQKSVYEHKDQFWFKPINPDNETNEEILKKLNQERLPLILKNTSLSGSKGVFVIKSKADLIMVLDSYRKNQEFQRSIVNINNFVTRYFNVEEIRTLELEYGTNIPPFVIEQCVDLNDGWIEYCYEGCVLENGTIIHYGLKEKLHSKEHFLLADITPPLSYKKSNIPHLKSYIEKYVNVLVKHGYVRQFFNIDLWARKDQNKVEIIICETNPRCAHKNHIAYKIAYKTNLFAENLHLVAFNEPPEVTPMKLWEEAQHKYCLRVYVTIEGDVGEKISDILDYTFIDQIEKNHKVDYILHVKQRDDVILEYDSGLGLNILQIYKECKSHAEAAAYELAICDLIYRKKRTNITRSKYWLEKAEKFGITVAKELLTE